MKWKKKTASLLLAGCLAMSSAPTVALAANPISMSELAGETQSYVAQIGGQQYKTLQAAVEAAEETTEIDILCDILDGTGIKVTGDKKITFDLNNHTYVTNKPLVGSSNTETNGFQLLKSAEVTFKNGILKAGDGTRILIQNYSNLTLENVTVDGSTYENCEYALSNNHGKVNVTGNTSIKAGSDKMAFDVCWAPQAGYSEGTQVVIDTTGIITGKMELSAWGDNIGNAQDSKSTLTIKNGYFNGALAVDEKLSDVAAKQISITGGYFTSDPSSYTAQGKIVLPSDKTDYTYMVVDTAAEPKVSGPVVELDESITDNAEEVKTAVAGVSVQGLQTYANVAASEISAEDAEAAKQALKAILGDGNADPIHIYAQTYLNIKAVAYNADSCTLDITPLVRIVASTKSDEKEFDFDTNAVVYGEPKELNVSKPVEVSIPLPQGFTTASTVYVQHTDKGYEYDAAVTASTAKFTNPHGFSTFTVSKDTQAVAQVNDTKYTSLQTAIDQVDADTVITVLKNSSAVIQEEKTVKVKVEQGVQVDIQAAEGYSVSKSEPDENGVVTYTVVSNACKKDSSCPLSNFKDTKPNEWYHDGIHYVLEHGLMIGVSKTEFAPDTSVSRAMLAQILYKNAQSPSVTATSHFSDVSEDKWYYKAVTWAAENNVVAGCGNGKFEPDAVVTREEMAQMLYANKKKPTVSGELNFSDAGDTSSWAKDAMLWATQNHIITGAAQEDHTILLDPKGKTARSQAAAMIMQYIQNMDS